MLNHSTSERPWWEKPQVHPKQFWYQEHRSELLAQAQNERLIKRSTAGRPGVRTRLLSGIGDGLVSFGLWLKARSRPLEAS